jgi:hypothetical protein
MACKEAKLRREFKLPAALIERVQPAKRRSPTVRRTTRGTTARRTG